jgi:non-ribosomal peptide synthetase component E (peptide arylation enzyme)
MQTEWSNPRIPPSEVCVLRPLLDRRAKEIPDKVFAKFADGSAWSYAELREITTRTAAALQALGVRQGDHVLSWLPNGTDALRVWFRIELYQTCPVLASSVAAPAPRLRAAAPPRSGFYGMARPSSAPRT